MIKVSTGITQGGTLRYPNMKVYKLCKEGIGSPLAIEGHTHEWIPAEGGMAVCESCGLRGCASLIPSGQSLLVDAICWLISEYLYWRINRLFDRVWQVRYQDANEIDSPYMITAFTWRGVPRVIRSHAYTAVLRREWHDEGDTRTITWDGRPEITLLDDGKWLITCRYGVR